jgi:Tol biopolymer transport system component
MSAGNPGKPLVASIPATVSLDGPVYVGIGVCSHDAKVLETAVFSNVSIQELPATEPHANPENVRSKISIYDLETRSVHVAYTADKLWEAPNWSPDGKYLIANSGGVIYRFVLDAKGAAQPEKLALDKAYDCNNDKALSPDGKRLAFSAQHSPAHGSQVYVSNADGTSPQMVTANIPSYFHGWSPDGRSLAFVGERGGNFDIYRVSSTGGKEERLTSSPGFDDGPDYSPDGKWIYINSDRSGKEAAWRFPANGAGPDDMNAEMVVSDGLEDWFPHIAPNGKKLVYIGYPAGTPTHNPRNVHIAIKLVAIDHGKVASTQKTLVEATGGQGTMNVNSWSPDSMRFAYVTYEPIP